MRLTAAQTRYLEDIRAEPSRRYNGRARLPLKALERAGLITVDWDADLATKGNGSYMRWRLTAIPAPGTVRQDPTEPPSCPHGHGPMRERPAADMTAEQLWCGRWWDCAAEHCGSTVLWQSQELMDQAALQRAAAGGEEPGE